MNKFRKKIAEHIQGYDIDDSSLIEILTQFPELRYEGVCYRLLSFESEMDISDISKDKSFSKNIEGALLFADQAEFVQLYSANVIGLDVNKATAMFLIEDEFKEENEIIAITVADDTLKFSGHIFDFRKWIRNKCGIIG